MIKIVRKKSATKKLTFKDLQIGDLFTCSGYSEAVWLKTLEQERVTNAVDLCDAQGGIHSFSDVVHKLNGTLEVSK